MRSTDYSDGIHVHLNENGECKIVSLMKQRTINPQKTTASTEIWTHLETTHTIIINIKTRITSENFRNKNRADYRHKTLFNNQTRQRHAHRKNQPQPQWPYTNNSLVA